PFFSISGSDFVEMFVGVGASRVRDLFAQAKESSPSIIFLDEIDAVGRRRGTGMGGGHDEREQTLNAILVEMDGFETDQKVIVIAATNRSDVLDPALLRPGRFDRHVYVDLPDVKGREEILRVHASDVHLGDDVDLKTVAKSTPGFSGADLENLINEAALIAVLDDHDSIFMSDIEKARDKVLFGRAKNSRVIDPEEKLNTAYHEAGHATVAYFNPKADNPHKITVIPHGKALGMTSFLPEKERLDYPKKRLMAILEVAYGGRVAEELFCDDISAGAENDIQRITDIARKMVTSWGMSEKLGPLHYDENSETMFLGRDVQRVQHHSDAITQIIDEEIKALTSEAYKNARELLAAHEREIKILAQALFDVETINYEDMVALFETGKLPSAAGLNGAATTTDTPAPSAPSTPSTPADPFSVQPIEPNDTTPDSTDGTTPA
ncbi:MAG: AAA family ATPase, partial [Planctomycetota bacterium]